MTQALNDVVRKLFERRLEKSAQMPRLCSGEAAVSYGKDKVVSAQLFDALDAAIFFNYVNGTPIGYISFSRPSLHMIGKNAGCGAYPLSMSTETEPFMIALSGSMHSPGFTSDKINEIIAAKGDRYALIPPYFVAPELEFTEIHGDLVRAALKYTQLWLADTKPQDQEVDTHFFRIIGKTGPSSSETDQRKEAGFYKQIGARDSSKSIGNFDTCFALGNQHVYVHETFMKSVGVK